MDYHPKNRLGSTTQSVNIYIYIYISSNVKILEAAHMNMMHMGIEPTSSDVTNQKTVGLTIKKVRCKKEQLECN